MSGERRTSLSGAAGTDTIRIRGCTTRIDQSTEVNDRMTANLAMSVGNTLILAFFVVCAIGVVAGVYAARALKKAEQQQAPKRNLED
jgi:cell division protein FtsL